MICIIMIQFYYSFAPFIMLWFIIIKIFPNNFPSLYGKISLMKKINIVELMTAIRFEMYLMCMQWHLTESWLLYFKMQKIFWLFKKQMDRTRELQLWALTLCCLLYLELGDSDGFAADNLSCIKKFLDENRFHLKMLYCGFFF